MYTLQNVYSSSYYYCCCYNTVYCQLPVVFVILQEFATNEVHGVYCVVVNNMTKCSRDVMYPILVLQDSAIIQTADRLAYYSFVALYALHCLCALNIWPLVAKVNCDNITSVVV